MYPVADIAIEEMLLLVETGTMPSGKYAWSNSLTKRAFKRIDVGDVTSSQHFQKTVSQKPIRYDYSPI